MENKEIKKIENNEILFFLGAGASVRAEVPDTMGFIYGKEGFKEHIKDEEEEQSTLQEILTVLEKRQEEINNKKYELFTKKTNNNEKSEQFEVIKREKEKFEKIDVELVLETLYKLNNKEVGVLPDFYDEATFKIKGKEESLKSLEKELRRFIREKTIVSEDKIDYLAPLKEFLDEYEMLDIFSVNYDICIEQFCKKYGLRYTDGFELYWHTELFDQRDYDVKLYKIHGSVMWYLTDRGTYVKIPIASTEKDEIELITGETAKTLMVYPMGGKWEYAEPLLELIRRLHKRLGKANVCVVIGYSFRDDYIRKIFFEAARKNKDLTMFLISPDAGKTYYDKLEFIDKDKGIPSSLEGKVICWNYPMEKVLRDNCLYRSLGKLSDILKEFEKARKFKRELGSKVGAFEHGMHEVVSKCTEIGYTALAEKILEKELGITVDNLKESRLFVRDEQNDIFKVLCGLGVNHLYSGRYDKGKRYFKDLKSILKRSLERGNEYFDLHCQQNKLIKEQLSNEEQKEKLDAINQSICQIKENNKESLPLYEWFLNSSYSRWTIRLQSGFIDILDKEIKLRSREDDPLIVKLKVILDKCSDMKKLLEIPLLSDIYKGGEYFDLQGSHGSCRAETRRKTDAEEKLTEIVEALEDLIILCEEKEKEAVQ